MIQSSQELQGEQEIEVTLAAWWSELLGIEEVTWDDDFFELGGHSLIGVYLFSQVKKIYGLDLGLATLFEARTVRELAQRIREASKHSECKPWSPLVPIQPKGTRPPLYWIPGGYGTSLLAFKDVSLLLGPEQPVWGFEAKMPDVNEELESIPDRAARFVGEMMKLQPQGPYSLIGFCSGGYIAFEMAQQLVAKGQTVGFLGLVECRDENHPRSWSGKALFWIERTIWRVGKVVGRGPKGVVLWALGRCKSSLSSAARKVRELVRKPVPPLPTGETDTYDKVRRVVDQYRVVSYPGRTVVLIGANSYNFCGLSRSVDPRLVWCKLSQGGSEIREIPGDHTEMLQAPNMYYLADELKRYLSRQEKDPVVLTHGAAGLTLESKDFAANG